MIRFRCEHCRQWLTIAETRAGETGKCPLCRQTTHVPQASETPPPDEAESAGRRHAMSRPPAPGHPPLELIRAPSEPDKHADQKAAFYCELQGRPAAASDPALPPAPLAVPVSRARLIDVFLYPMNFDSLTRVALFALGLWIVGLFPRVFYPESPPLTLMIRVMMLMVLLYLFIAWWAAFYFAHCVFDSAKGGTRAPAIWSGYVYTGGDLPSMMLLGAVAFCLGFTALYAAVTRDVGVYFRILTAMGVFFLPMLLLACTMFGGREALHPRLIVTSIIATLPAYLGLIVRLVLLTAFATFVHWDCWWLGMPRVFPYAADLYVLWIAGHLLGRFYLRQKDKLGWDL